MLPFVTVLASDKIYRGSFARMPLSADIDKNDKVFGAYIDLIRELDRLTNTETEIVVAPFQRSVRNLIRGEADYHIPLIEIPGTNLEELPYAFSTETLFQVAFVLYSNKNNPLDINKLHEYDISTDLAHVDFFPFPVKGTSCLSCAIEMVDRGRLDGFIFAQNEIDPFVRQFNLKNVYRQFYKNFNVKIIIPKGQAGKTIDAYFSKGIKILRQRGEYDKILAPIITPYIEWQP